MCLTADPGVASLIPARSHTFLEIDHEIISTVILLPSADSFKKGCLSREFCTGCPRELLYADDLMISAESMEELLVKLKTWNLEMEKKGLPVNMA